MGGLPRAKTEGGHEHPTPRLEPWWPLTPKIELDALNNLGLRAPVATGTMGSYTAEGNGPNFRPTWVNPSARSPSQSSLGKGKFLAHHPVRL